MREIRGFSLVELLIAVAITGILLGVGAVVFKPGRNAVNQAATVLSSAVTQARFEAIRSNRTSHFIVTTAGNGSYAICVDEDQDGTCSGTEYVEQALFGTGDYARVKLSATTLSGGSVRFDSRGVPLDAVAGATMTVSERDGSYSQVVVLNSTGRAEVQ